MTDRFNISDLIKKGYSADSNGLWIKNSKKPVKAKKVSKTKPIDVLKAYEQTVNLLYRAKTTETYTFDVMPMGKPSFQKSDKWRTLNNSNPKLRQRDIVTKWIDFKKKLSNEAKNVGFVMPASGASIQFIIPMPESWSDKKKENMNGNAHQQRPDLDNMLKGFFDSVCEEDSYIWNYYPEKIWGTEGKIIVKINK